MRGVMTCVKGHENPTVACGDEKSPHHHRTPGDDTCGCLIDRMREGEFSGKTFPEHATTVSYFGQVALIAAR